jgi:hypothetical protein
VVVAKMRNIDAPHNGIMYHYTGLSGLMGIIKTGKLWATDIRYLNDTGEATYGMNRIAEILDAELHKWGDPMWLRSLKFHLTHITIDRRTFVACFCKIDDLLSQWRGYGRLGYSIGFDRNALRQQGAEEPYFALRDISYKDETFCEEVLAILETLHHSYPSPLPQGSADTVLAATTPVIVPALTDLLTLIPKFKNPAFKQEEEVRAEHLHVPSEVLELRESQLGPTPYVLLNVGQGDKSSIRTIRIGPTSHPNEAQQGINDLLARYDLPHVDVLRSTVPYRWPSYSKPPVSGA